MVPTGEGGREKLSRRKFLMRAGLFLGTGVVGWTGSAQLEGLRGLDGGKRQRWMDLGPVSALTKSDALPADTMVKLGCAEADDIGGGSDHVFVQKPWGLGLGLVLSPLCGGCGGPVAWH